MTDDEILALAALTSNEPTDAEMIAFARAVAAKEREACAEISFEISLEALRNTPLRQALEDTGTDRGAWSDVPDATKWVDELRGDDEFECPRCGHCCWTPEDMAYRPGGLSVEEPPNSATDFVEPIGEVQIEQLDRPFNAGKVVLHFYGEPPPAGTKLYAAPPKREWQWLTYSELQEISNSMKTWNSFDITDFYVAIEAKLREKNYG